MKCLIIEDDKSKSTEIKKFLTENYEHMNVEITIKHSYNSGLREAMIPKYDLILLDMSMPTYDITNTERGGRPRHFAGKEIIQQMHRRNIFTPVIVVTGFENFGEGADKISLEQLNTKLKELKTKAFCGVVFYSIVEKTWQQKIKSIIDKLN